MIKFPDIDVPNDKLIILLIDRYAASAGENFTDQILSLENTLVIGQNTAGVLLTGGMDQFFLPNSDIQIDMGIIYNIWDEAHFKEGAGISTDVWVIGDALQAALAMLRKR